MDMSEPIHADSAPAATVPTVARDAVTRGLRQLGTMAQRLIDAGEVPGLSFAVVHRDEVISVDGLGARRSGSAERINGDTVFQLASLSKPIASTVVAAIISDS